MCSRVYQGLCARNAHEKEFLQAAEEMLTSLSPVLISTPNMKRPACSIALSSRSASSSSACRGWTINGKVQVNRGFRVQFNSAIGPYKGGLRLHPSVNLGIIKFLGFEQIFKNSLTGLPIGGGKGGSDFDPKGKSDRGGHALLPELYDRAVPVTSAPDTDVPAGDIGVGAPRDRLSVRPV